MGDLRINTNQETSVPNNFYSLLFQYLAHWPWFLVSVCICCIGMLLLIFYTAPVYKTTASVLIKVSEQNRYSASLSETMGMEKDLGLFSMTNNFDNEVQILQSKTLIHKVICDLNLYTDIREERVWGYDRPLYKNSPINIYMTPQEAEKLESEIEIHLVYLKNGKLYVQTEYSYTDKYGEEQEIEEEKIFDSLPAIYPTNVGVISFTRNDSVEILTEDGNAHLVAYINAPMEIADIYKENMTLKPASRTTTIANITIKNEFKKRGEDFVNYLINNYNQDANDEKNEVAQKSAEFIKERLEIINQELSQTESQLVDFKQSSGLTNLTNDTQMALEENSKYEQQRMANATQIRLVHYLKDYIENPVNFFEIIPANVGLEDVNLNTVIGRYNDLLIERKRLLRTSSENNPAVINMNASINAMYQNVKTAVDNALKGLQITQDDLNRQVRKLEYQINKVPQNEKEFLTISRQQEIKASLYTMLLQKREENAITLASTAKNGRIIENTITDKKPAFPRIFLFLTIAFILGIVFPAVLIYLNRIFRYKIEDNEEIKRLTNLQTICEIPLEKRFKDTDGVAVEKGRNGIIEEAFRGLRTQLQFLSSISDQVILVTSTMPNEGKTFVASNLSVSLSLLNKRVILVGLDIRNPKLHKTFGINRAQGVTDYLRDPEHIQLSELIQKSDKYENLDILISGTIAPNPTELLSGNTFSEMINNLRKKYNYIVIDTAPISIVADTSIIALEADMGVFVCRMDYTPKKNLTDINILRDQCSLTKLICAVNGVDLSKRKHKYRYTYGKRYGYGGYYYNYGGKE